MTVSTPANGATTSGDGDDPGSLEHQLYQFMMNNIPYRYDEDGTDRSKPHVMTKDDPLAASEDAPETGPGGMIYSVIGQAASNFNEKPLTKDGEQRIRDNPQDSIWWSYAAKSYRITKALKIPYVVIQDGAEVVKHILVGYSGIDGGGG